MTQPSLRLLLILLLALSACTASKKGRRSPAPVNTPASGSATANPSEQGTRTPDATMALSMDRPLPIDRREFTAYAKTFLGTPYKYGSADPGKGFDCSGFLYHIFRHYHVKSPRSSYDYEYVGTAVSPQKALPGDLILFRGENSRRIGHIGIITSNKEPLNFIHAAGSGTGVIISTFSGYYKKQFVKIIRVLQ
ncbi:C40 family peptidase [Niabella pedocola]|uniref:C40 family peptidase n=1 Tax=Niabella pedocola TaxID=1752077 RepID=A0ABS8PVR9_9BACT|nr:C40 family peptidase [Niabella pedocola]MCD2425172.1 C40 family peptidase [Niabella pedocola]